MSGCGSRNFRSGEKSASFAIRVAVSSPTLCPVRFATMSATRRQCAGVRPACVVPSGRTTSRSRSRALPIGLAAVVADKSLGVGLRQPFGSRSLLFNATGSRYERSRRRE